jgi:hypothetical protein
MHLLCNGVAAEVFCQCGRGVQGKHNKRMKFSDRHLHAHMDAQDTSCMLTLMQ